MPNISIDANRCKRCGLCVAACPAAVYSQSGKGAVPEPAQAGRCIACGHCLAVCSNEAVIHDDFPPGTILSVDLGEMPSPAQVQELLRSRRSVRRFKDAPPSQEDLALLLEAARTAPSAHNIQNVEYVVVRDKALMAGVTKATVAYMAHLGKQISNPLLRGLFRIALSREEIESAAGMLGDFDFVQEEFRQGRDPILRGAPCIIIAHSRRNINFPETNAALALHNAALAAHAQGLGGFLLGYVVGACKRDRTIPNLLEIPRSHDVYAGLAVGYPSIAYPKWVQRRPLQVRWK